MNWIHSTLSCAWVVLTDAVSSDFSAIVLPASNDVREATFSLSCAAGVAMVVVSGSAIVRGDSSDSGEKRGGKQGQARARLLVSDLWTGVSSGS